MTASNSHPDAADGMSSRGTVQATIVLILGLFICFAGVLGYSTWRAYEEAQTRARDRADAASQVVSINARWVVELAQQALTRIDEALGPDMWDQTGTTVRDLRQAVVALPGRVRAHVVNQAGETIYSTEGGTQLPSMSEQAFFTVPASGQTFYTSSLITGAGGEQFFAFSRRIEREGRFAGVAIISYDARLLQDVWESLDLDPDSTVGIVRGDGQLVARYPFPPGPLDLSNYVLFTDYLKAGDNGTYFAISPADQISRYVGYRKVDGIDLIALASISATSAMAPFWRHTAITMLMAFPAALGLAFASVWIVRLLQRDARRQTELGRALEINRLLFRDTHHRVKNNLQSVQSLVRMQNIPADAKLDLQRRIAAMTAVHEHIYRADQFVEVEAAEFVPAIVLPLLQSFDSKVEATFDIDAVVVDRDHTTPLALLINEVVTNSLKYAYDDQPGTLHIEMKAAGANRARIVVRDNGRGFDPDTSRPGMGTRLIGGMMQQLDGSYTYAKDGGTVFEADIALKSTPIGGPGKLASAGPQLAAP